MIFYCVVTSFLNAVCSLMLGCAAFVRDRRNPLNVTFAWLSLSIAVWAGAYFCWQISVQEITALLFCRMLTAGAIAIAVCYYHFIQRLIGRPIGISTVIGYVLVAVFLALVPDNLLVGGVARKMMFPYWPEPGPLYPAYLAVFFGYSIATWTLLWRAYVRAGTARQRNQLRWVLVGTVVGIIGGSTNYFLWYDIPIPPIGNGLVAVYLGGVGYAIFRLRLMEVDYALVKLVGHVIGVLPFSALFPALFILAEKLGATPSQVFALQLFGSAVGTLALFWFFPVLRRRIDDLLAATVLRERYERREELGALAGRITSMRDDDVICRETVRVVHEVVKAPAAVYLRNESEGTFELRDSSGFEAERLSARLPPEAPVLRWLAEQKKPLVLDEVEALTQSGAASVATRRELVEFRQNAGVLLAVPIVGDVYFFGALLVGHRPLRRGFSELDVSLLDSIGGHIGLSLRARQLERRANQTEKLISLGTLAAGLAHELRNPLVSIQTFASLLAEMPDDGSIPAEFKATVLRDVGRIAGIVENVSAFAANNQVTFSWVSLDEVVKQAYEIVGPDYGSARVGFSFGCEKSVPVYANQNQLLQVFINLLNNAVQALKGRENARVSVQAGPCRLEDGRAGMEIVIADNGPGIAPEVLPRLFEPFTTTKATGTRTQKGGMGLGLAIVKRIIDGHNGLIQVRSIPGEGTTFVITIPTESMET